MKNFSKILLESILATTLLTSCSPVQGNKVEEINPKVFKPISGTITALERSSIYALSDLRDRSTAIQYETVFILDEQGRSRSIIYPGKSDFKEGSDIKKLYFVKDDISTQDIVSASEGDRKLSYDLYHVKAEGIFVK